MITFKTGNLLDAKVEALVNTVNTVGVMGKGIALQFKNAFPENFKAYRDAVKTDSVQLGMVFIVPVNPIGTVKFIINFPTKGHWRYPSKLAWIESGLKDLKIKIKENKIKSVALPLLGCGNGGLDWNQVRPLIEKEMNNLEVEVIIYEPNPEIQEVLKKEGRASIAKGNPR
ncbi:type II toxin-antitoxin system antitoxin DNA ADP-ribosyl glycohydrolase DarG [Flavitalea flava]